MDFRDSKNSSLPSHITVKNETNPASICTIQIWRYAHDVGLLWLERKRHGGQHIGPQVNGEDDNRGERQRHVEGHVHEERQDLRDVRAEGVSDRVFEIVKQNSTLFDAVNDRREISIQKNNVGRVLRHLRTGDAHRHTDVGMAVIGWSPVTMMTLIPAVWHLATACGTPGRGGSIMANRPMKVMPRSPSVATEREVCLLATGRLTVTESTVALLSHEGIGWHLEVYFFSSGPVNKQTFRRVLRLGTEEVVTKKFMIHSAVLQLQL
eukprot:172741_1